MSSRHLALATTLILASALVTSGCATKKYVKDQVTTSEQQTGKRIDQVEGQVESSQTKIDDHDRRLGEHDSRISSASKTAQDALERAEAAGKLAQGKFLYEVTFTDDQIQFASDKADLNDAAKATLDAFAADIKAKNQNVFIEIQGHTDGTGADTHNEELGLKRAESVRRYLSGQHGFALHRISVISYGESMPVADNKTPAGRAQNRRVVVVVLQ